MSDLDENEDDSERAVELLGLRDLNDLGPPELPNQNNDSFGEMMDNMPPPIIESTVVASNYGSNTQTKKPNLGGRVHASKPSGLKIGGLSLDIDRINEEHDEKE